jgi:3D (Asp-Asp-Asp) domain-containing protein
MKTKKNTLNLTSSFLFTFAFLLFTFSFLLSVPVQAANPTMPDITVPELKIKIPNIVFTTKEEILEKCDKDPAGNVLICYFPWIGEYIVGVYKYAVGIVGIIAAIVLMVGGIIWLTAGGNQSRVGEAQNWIKGSITGLVLLLSSYVLLFQINPALLEFKPIAISVVQELEPYVANRKNGVAEEYKAKSCKNLEAGKEYDFYTTGYIKWPYSDSLYNRCMIALNCECPNGNKKNSSENCSKWWTSSKMSNHPCAIFDPNTTPYCNKSKSGKPPVVGKTVAADETCFAENQKLCIEGHEYAVEDKGSDIEGMRLDIFSADKAAAEKQNGVVKVKIGPCSP